MWTDHWAFKRRFDRFFNYLLRLIFRIRRISDQNKLQKSNVSADDSDDCLSSKTLRQIIRKVQRPDESKQFVRTMRMVRAALRLKTWGKCTGANAGD